MGERHREPALADPTDSGQREQPRVWMVAGKGVEIVVAADQRRAVPREVAAEGGLAVLSGAPA